MSSGVRRVPALAAVQVVIASAGEQPRCGRDFLLYPDQALRLLIEVQKCSLQWTYIALQVGYYDDACKQGIRSTSPSPKIIIAQHN